MHVRRPSQPSDAHYDLTHFAWQSCCTAVYRRGLAACQSCPSAVGADDPEVLGVGDECGGNHGCAATLSCEGGICTKSCASDDECAARADDCKLQVQYANVCAAGKCTRSCGDDFACQSWISGTSTCTEGACTL